MESLWNRQGIDYSCYIGEKKISIVPEVYLYILTISCFYLTSATVLSYMQFALGIIPSGLLIHCSRKHHNIRYIIIHWYQIQAMSQLLFSLQKKRNYETHLTSTIAVSSSPYTQYILHVGTIRMLII